MFPDRSHSIELKLLDKEEEKRSSDSLPLLDLQSGVLPPIPPLVLEQLLPRELWYLGLDLGSQSSSDGVEKSVRVDDGN